jgi:proteasome lid subunit RPN8/RPN11
VSLRCAACERKRNGYSKDGRLTYHSRVSLDDAAPWSHGGIQIGASAIERLESDAAERYGRNQEACGYLVGPLKDPLLCDEAVPVVNLADKLHALDPKKYFRDGRTSFAFREKDFEQAIAKGRILERPVKVLYHSHLDADAYFSATDAAVLSGGSPPSSVGGPSKLGSGPLFKVAFLVTSVRRRGDQIVIADHKLYVWNQRAFEVASLSIEPR